MYDTGTEKQLFIDHRFIENSDGIRLAVNPPVKRPGAVLRADRPWDAFALGWYSVVEDDGLYRMWYYGAERDPRPTRIAGQKGPLGHLTGYEVPADTDPNSVPTPGLFRLCYATSTDGLTWEKPDLGLIEFDGSKDNNIVHEGYRLAYVFLDPHGREEERYKLIHWTGPGIAVATSADGLHWNEPAHQVSSLAADTQKMAWWEPRLGRYVVFLRVMVDEESGPQFPFVEAVESESPVLAPKCPRPRRAVGRIEVDDILAPWPEAEIRTVLAADEHDPPNSDIYTHGLYRYPYAADAYFMFPMTYQHFREGESPVPNDGLNDTQFCASRNGIHWMRYERQPYISRGLAGDGDGGGTHGTEWHFRHGKQLVQLYGASPWSHGGFRRLTLAERQDESNWGGGYIGAAVQRLDGFVSADAGFAGGSLVTPVLKFAGDHLELNIDVAAMGEARVELQDERGLPLPGFALDACDRVLVNDVDHTVSWKGQADLSSIAGTPVRLRLAMHSAKLFAFQFQNAGRAAR